MKRAAQKKRRGTRSLGCARAELYGTPAALFLAAVIRDEAIEILYTPEAIYDVRALAHLNGKIDKRAHALASRVSLVIKI